MERKRKGRRRHRNFYLSDRLANALNQRRRERIGEELQHANSLVDPSATEEAVKEDDVYSMLLRNVPYNADSISVLQFVVMATGVDRTRVVSCDVLKHRRTKRPLGLVHLAFSKAEELEKIKKSSPRGAIGYLWGRKIFFRVLATPVRDHSVSSDRVMRYRLTSLRLAEQTGTNSFVTRWGVPDLKVGSPLEFEVSLDDRQLLWSFSLNRCEDSEGVFSRSYKLFIPIRDLRRKIKVDSSDEDFLTLIVFLPYPPQVWSRTVSREVMIFLNTEGEETRECDVTGCGAIGACLVYFAKVAASGEQRRKLISKLSQYHLVESTPSDVPLEPLYERKAVEGVSCLASKPSLLRNPDLDGDYTSLPFEVLRTIKTLISNRMISSDQFSKSVHELSRHLIAKAFNSEETQDSMLKSPVEAINNWLDALEPQIALPFEILYALETLISKGIVARSKASSGEFCRYLQGLGKDIAVKALNSMGTQDSVLESPLEEIKKWVGALQQEPLNGEVYHKPAIEGLKKVENGLMSVHRVTITPTRIFVNDTYFETSNRVLRNFKSNFDRFLRVSFRDENFDRLPCQCNENLMDRVRHFMKGGFTLAGRVYRFLASSSSQLQEASAWFFADAPGGTSVHDIRRWMGDFSDIRVVSKYAARMGQCFSSTREGLRVERREWKLVEDVERNGYCFSDGCGLISRDLSERLAEKVRVAKLKDSPSAFQIRFNGAKGMVSAWPQHILQQISGESETKLIIRRSMKKFEVDHGVLEVLTMSKFRPAFLNQQIITLLSTRGVPDDSLMRLQDNMLDSLQGIFDSGDRALGIVLQLSGDEHSKDKIVDLISAGFGVMHERFLNEQLLCFRRYHLQSLEKKSRVFAPSSACLLGIMDETGTLEQGEVFVQIYRERENETFLLDDQDVVVGKNPMLHPGDIRVLRARGRGIPESLAQIVNCVVFPSKGSRPHPNECSGSDLDGDMYFVTWNRELIPRIRDSPPMDYTAAKAQEKTEPVSMDDIISFFIDFITNDSLGVISYAHLANADLSDQYAYDPKCIELARLHSIAVDFPKTGVPAVMGMCLKPPSYPDFMGKGSKKSHASNKIIGRMHKKVLEFASRNKIHHVHQDLYLLPNSAMFDRDLVIDGHEKYIPESRYLLAEYQRDLLGIMRKFDLKNEVELLTGTVLRHGRYFDKKAKLFDIRKLAIGEAHRLRRKHEKLFRSGIPEDYDSGLEDSDVDDEGDAVLFTTEGTSDSEEESESEFDEGTSNLDLLQRASANYVVAYRTAARMRETPALAKENEIVGLLSYPWITAHRQLCEIKSHRMKQRQEILN